MNNSSSFQSQSTTGTTGTPLTYAINFIFVPIVYSLGFLGNSICLYVLIKQIKNNSGYMYQVVIVLNDLFGTVASTLFRLGRVWYGLAYNSGSYDLRSNAVLMGYTAYFGTPATSVCHFVALSMTVCISVDRTLVFYKPFYYKSINKKRQFFLSLFATLAFSVFVNILEFFALTLTRSPENDLYYISTNKRIVVENVAYTFFVYFRLVSRFLLIAAILILNVMIIVKYRERKNNPINKSKTGLSESLTENTLALYLLLHSFVLGLGQLPLAIACVPISMDPFWTGTTWTGRITADIVNTLGAVQWAAGFLFFLGLSKEFRRRARETLLPCIANKVHPKIVIRRPIEQISLPKRDTIGHRYFEKFSFTE